jgi:hypothetical protein
MTLVPSPSLGVSRDSMVMIATDGHGQGLALSDIEDG